MPKTSEEIYDEIMKKLLPTIEASVKVAIAEGRLAGFEEAAAIHKQR
jgi:hypothetical protein